ncbi:MAG: HEAT repeat domain-containing protein [Candidatus Scalindua sp.]|nr:HEAT repeat domain-containing protein [Candidatus Scalindua sp.]
MTLIPKEFIGKENLTGWFTSEDNYFMIFKNLPYQIILILLFPVLQPDKAMPEDLSQSITVIARHGSLENTPENTFASFRKALTLGIGGLEVDVRKTKDGNLILMHDGLIDRTTDGKGYVDALLYDEIKQYDAGSWRGGEFTGERVPLLADALQFAKDHHLKILLNVKEHGIEQQVLSLINEIDIIDQIYFSGTLETILNEETAALGTNLIFIPENELTNDIIDLIHQKHGHVGTKLFDSDNRDKMRKRMIQGVDVILTDYPSVAMDLLHYEKGTGQVTNDTFNNDENTTVKTESGIHKEQVDQAINLMTEGEPDKSRMAALAMSTFPTEISLPRLKDLLTYNKKLKRFSTIKNFLSTIKHAKSDIFHSMTVRKNAAWALGLTKDKRAVQALALQLETKNSELKREIILALQKISDKKAIPYLNEIVLNDKDPFVRYDAARALGEIRHLDAVYTLTEALQRDLSWMVKSGCACALGKIGSDKAVHALKNVLVTDAGVQASWTRKTAAWALAEIGGRGIEALAFSLRDNERSTRRRASWALIQIGEPSIPHLIRALRDPNRFARARSAMVLGWIGDPKAVNSLSWALNDKDPVVRKSAAWALGKIGGSEAKTVLEKRISSEEEKDVLEYAKEAIQRISL